MMGMAADDKGMWMVFSVYYGTRHLRESKLSYELLEWCKIKH